MKTYRSIAPVILCLALAGCVSTTTQQPGSRQSAPAGRSNWVPAEAAAPETPAPAMQKASFEPATQRVAEAEEVAPAETMAAEEPVRSSVVLVPVQTAKAAPTPGAPESFDAAAVRDLAMMERQPARWAAFLSRWDANGDESIDPAEYARYKEWHAKRTAIKPRFDKDDDGQIDGGMQPEFRAAVRELNEEYFVNPE